MMINEFALGLQAIRTVLIKLTHQFNQWALTLH